MRRWVHRAHLAGLVGLAAVAACRREARVARDGALAVTDDAGRRVELTPPAPHVRVAFVVWDAPPIVIGGGSYLDQLATLAGADNVFHDVGSATATVAIEAIAARDPDAIVVLRDSAPAAPPGFAARREWQ